MNHLFSEQEALKIFEGSQWIPEEYRNSSGTDACVAFLCKLDKLCGIFNSEPPANRLFLAEPPETPALCVFAPFYHFLRQELIPAEKEDIFQDGAFRDWGQSFPEALFQIFGNLAFSELEACAGAMTTPTTLWVKEKAMPCIRSGEHFRAMALRYPIFARQIIEFVFLQLAHLQELIQALTEDLPKHYSFFFPGEAMPPISHISASVSDRHQGGKCVHLITFANGNRLVYKPHSLEMDRGAARWFRWLCDRCGVPPLPFPKSVDTPRGGFCQFVQAKPLEQKAEATWYFQRIGFLLGAIYLLQGNDLHTENIIAAGKEPVIIDNETLLTPPSCLRYQITPVKIRFSINQMSVLPTMGTLPGFREMKIGGICYQFPGSHNLPVWEGSTLTAEQYPMETWQGFVQAVHTILENKAEAARMLEECFLGCRFRMVLKPTSAYVKLINALGCKPAQCDSKRYFHLTEQIKIRSGKIPHHIREQIFHSELNALDRLDVPFFEEALTKSMIQSLVQHWDTISEEVLRWEKQRLLFCLSKRPPAEGADRPLGAAPCCGNIENRLAVMASKLSRLLDYRCSPLAVGREQERYLVSDSFLGVNCLLDSNLGTILALYALKKTFGLTSELDDLLQHAIDTLTDPDKCSPACTPGELGLADGAAGYLFGCTLLWEMGAISRECLHHVVRNLEVLTEKPFKLRFTTVDVVYGACDMMFALNRLPPQFHTEKLVQLHSMLLEIIHSMQSYAGMSSQSLSQLTASAAFGPFREKAVCNHTLHYGNAAALLHYADRLQNGALTEAERENADALCRILAEADRVLPEVSFPEDCIEIGLLHGMPGVLYSICRYLNPARVPSLWQA